jgi:curved DNA-binding protein CbpA
MPRLRYDSTNDYYALLGLPPGASAAEIQQAFHRLAKQIHPDRNPERSAWATERFQALNEAYHVLGDPELRREYDRQRWPHAPYTLSLSARPGARTPPAPPPRGTTGTGCATPRRIPPTSPP